MFSLLNFQKVRSVNDGAQIGGRRYATLELNVLID